MANASNTRTFLFALVFGIMFIVLYSSYMYTFASEYGLSFGDDLNQLNSTVTEINDDINSIVVTSVDEQSEGGSKSGSDVAGDTSISWGAVVTLPFTIIKIIPALLSYIAINFGLSPILQVTILVIMIILVAFLAYSAVLRKDQ